MNLLKRFPFSVPLLLLIFFNFTHEGTSTLVLSSLLAMSGGLLMGKMTLGGLMMMLMAANQQQNGQRLLRSLGKVPAPGGVSLPTGETSAARDGKNLVQDIQNLIVRRSIREKRSTSTAGVKSFKNSSISASVRLIDAKDQYRVMRQVANSDPLGCLPQALCGISAIPPSKQSGFLNDYAYLLKTVLSRDEDVDDLDREDDDVGDIDKFDEIKYEFSDKKKKTQQVTKSDANTKGKKPSPTSSSTSKTKKKVTFKSKSKKKRPQNADDESSEEEVALNEQEMDNILLKEAFEMEHLANEELLDEEPEFLPYAMRDAEGLKVGPYEGPPGRPQDVRAPDSDIPDEYMGNAPSDLHKMSNSELDAMLAKINGPGRGPPRGPTNIRYPQNSGSFLSSLLPKISMGFTPVNKGNNFQEDPFFSGFKRSMKSESYAEGKVRQPTEEEQKLFKEMIVRRRKRMDLILSTKKELAEIKDPVEKFRIAADFGERVKSPRQCRILFNNCPFNYTQVLDMIAGLRKVVLGQPLHPEPEKGREKDTVVTLAPVITTQPPPAPPQPSAAMQNIINLNSGNGGLGVTTIQTQLPNGEIVEINLQMSNYGKGTKRRNNTKINRPKLSSSLASASTQAIVASKTKTKKRKPVDVQDLFDEDDGHPATADSKSKIHSSLGSLDSLKATMLAIEKINNVTVERRKQGKPVSYSNVLADLNLEKKTTNTITSTTPHPHPVTRPPTRKQQKQKTSKPQITYKKTSALAAALAQLTSSASVQADDDEVEEQLPTRRPTSVKIKRRPPFPPKNPQVNVTEEVETNTSTSGSNQQKLKVRDKQNVSVEEDEVADEEGDDAEEPSEEDEEEEDYNDNDRPVYDDYQFRSEIVGTEGPGARKLPINSPTSNIEVIQKRTSTKRRFPSRRQKRWRKPKKLYPVGNVKFSRIAPL